jgi:hypothetical protein
MNCKRYLPPEKLELFLNELPKTIKQEELGRSVNGLPIHMLQLGRGRQKIMMWSQMHGNESTTTKALFDLIPWLNKTEQALLLDNFTFYVIPQLNPDGAKAYTRLNANQVDLNRDAIDLSQPESKVLRAFFDRITPDYALNLHGQRTIYGAGPQGQAATLSFLAPSADHERSVTPTRAKAMRAIAAIHQALKKDLPQGIGRYNDQFNPNCVGDSFTQAGVPTLLFEAGHYPNDYQRERVRGFVFKAYQALFQYLLKKEPDFTPAEYFDIPENSPDYIDLVVSNIHVKERGVVHKNQQLALQYLEELKEGRVVFTPTLKAYGKELPFKFHRFFELSPKENDILLEFSFDKTIDSPYLNKLFSVNHLI